MYGVTIYNSVLKIIGLNGIKTTMNSSSVGVVYVSPSKGNLETIFIVSNTQWNSIGSITMVKNLLLSMKTKYPPSIKIMDTMKNHRCCNIKARSMKITFQSLLINSFPELVF